MPRSRLLLVACFIVVAAVCARLGIWQVHRLQERRAANAVAVAARSAPAAILNGKSLDSSLINRRVRVKGHYDHAHDIVLRSRTYRGVPGVELVSPLIPEGGGTAVLVNRGFVPSPDAVTIDPTAVREPGVLNVEGIALPLDSSGGAPLQLRDERTWARLDRTMLRTRLPYSIAPFVIRQAPDSVLSRFPRRLDPPELDDGPHLSYAIQWFAFTIIALVFAGIFLKQGRGSAR
jgi:surfeit locus 1 family protein